MITSSTLYFTTIGYKPKRSSKQSKTNELTKMGRSKPDKQNKTPTKNTSNKTQNITPDMAKPDSNTIMKEEAREKKTNPDKTFIRNLKRNLHFEAHTSFRRRLIVDRGKQQINDEGDIIDLDASVFEPPSDEDE
jgi:hypothetical protein